MGYCMENAEDYEIGMAESGNLNYFYDAGEGMSPNIYLYWGDWYGAYERYLAEQASGQEWEEVAEWEGVGDPEHPTEQEISMIMDRYEMNDAGEYVLRESQRGGEEDSERVFLRAMASTVSQREDLVMVGIAGLPDKLKKPLQDLAGDHLSPGRKWRPDYYLEPYLEGEMFGHGWGYAGNDFFVFEADDLGSLLVAQDLLAQHGICGWDHVMPHTTNQFEQPEPLGEAYAWYWSRETDRGCDVEQRTGNPDLARFETEERPGEDVKVILAPRIRKNPRRRKPKNQLGSGKKTSAVFRRLMRL